MAKIIVWGAFVAASMAAFRGVQIASKDWGIFPDDAAMGFILECCLSCYS